jgi:hypothetical protein
VQAADLNFGTRTLFLSFNDTLTFSAMQNTLDSVSDTGNIVVEAVYVLGGNNNIEVLPLVSLSVQDIQAIEQIVAAKIYAPVTLIGDLKNRSDVALVEIKSEVLNEETFIPLAVIETPVRESTSTTTTATSTAEQHVPAADETTATEPKQFVSLETFVNFNLAGVVRAEFIDNNRFTALTANALMLCEIYRESETDELKIRILSQVAETPTDVYSTPDEPATTDFVLNGELVFAFYDRINNNVLMRARSAYSNAVYALNTDTLAVTEIASDVADLTILAVGEGAVYFAVGRKVVYKYDIASGTNSELVSFEQQVSFERNADLSAFVINVTDMENETIQVQVFNANTGTMAVSDDIAGRLSFYRTGTNVLVNDDGFFNTALETVDERDVRKVLRTAQTVTVNRSEQYEVVEITESSVRIRFN